MLTAKRCEKSCRLQDDVHMSALITESPSYGVQVAVLAAKPMQIMPVAKLEYKAYNRMPHTHSG